jgi:hypothetical protein
MLKNIKWKIFIFLVAAVILLMIKYTLFEFYVNKSTKIGKRIENKNYAKRINNQEETQKNDKNEQNDFTTSTETSTSSTTTKLAENKANEEIKNQFDTIYSQFLWGKDGGGSGLGSNINYTVYTRNVLYETIKKYKINSMVDAPCGAMMWMPLLLANLSLETNKQFRYHGIDVVESVINASKIRFSNFSEEWKFSVIDFSQQNIPDNYELIFSRDALQHLPLEKVINALEMFSISKGSKYLAVGSYVKSTSPNNNIKVGAYFPVNLLKPPFNLTEFVEIIDEKTPDLKYLILYDIPGYLSKVDFNLIRKESKKFE